MQPTVDVAILPAEALAMEADCYVVVDLLRASTTIAVLFEMGLKDLTVVSDLADARDIAEREDRVLFGEVGGVAPEGFDYGNSPVEAMSLDLVGRRGVLFTTNGTLALCSLAGRGEVITGALANASAAMARAAKYDRTVIVCAGREAGRRFGLDDLAAAGILVQRLSRLVPGLEPGDGAGLAQTLPGYEDWLAVGLPQRTGRSGRLVAGSAHGRYLVGLGLGADIQFALQEDTTFSVPVVVEWGDGWARLEDARRTGLRGQEP